LEPFFKDAQNEAENRGNVVVFCACEENKLTVDGEFYFNISKPILQRKKKHIVNKPTTFNQHKTDDE
jgi:hypothetical protein